MLGETNWPRTWFQKEAARYILSLRFRHPPNCCAALPAKASSDLQSKLAWVSSDLVVSGPAAFALPVSSVAILGSQQGAGFYVLYWPRP